MKQPTLNPPRTGPFRTFAKMNFRKEPTLDASQEGNSVQARRALSCSPSWRGWGWVIRQSYPEMNHGKRSSRAPVVLLPSLGSAVGSWLQCGLQENSKPLQYQNH